MASICSTSNLPPELWSSILRLLSHRDLISLAQTSSSFQTISEPALYSTIDFAWLRPDTFLLPRLLATLLGRPSLGIYIDSIRLRDTRNRTGEWVYFDERIPRLPANRLLKNNAEEYIEKIDMPSAFKISLENGIGDGTVDAMVTLLVALAPNICSLDLDQLFALEMPLLGDFLKQNLCSSPPTQNAAQPFSRLQKVGVLRDRAYMSRENGLNAVDRLAFFYLPAIKSLSISIDDPDNFAWPGTPPTVSTLTSLQLDKIRERNLGPILEATPNLKQLNWTWLYGSCADKRYCVNLNLDTLVAAMQPLSNSLCELVLDGNHALTFNERRPPVLDIRGSLIGLKEFVSMRKLVLPWMFCMDTSPSKGPSMLDQLPCNLETLILTDGFRENKWMKWADHIWGSSHDNDRCALARTLVRTLNEMTRDLAPKLRRVALAWTPKSSERNEDMLNGIRRIREVSGVEILWQPSHGYAS